MSKVWKWEKNFWGEWEFRQRDSSNGSGILFFFIAVFIALVVISICFLISPLIFALLGFGLVDAKKYYAGLSSFGALIYLMIDINNKWITGYLVYGYTDKDGIFQKGFLGDDFVNLLYYSWIASAILASYFILKSWLVNKKEENLTSLKVNKTSQTTVKRKNQISDENNQFESFIADAHQNTKTIFDKVGAERQINESKDKIHTKYIRTAKIDFDKKSRSYIVYFNQQIQVNESNDIRNCLKSKSVKINGDGKYIRMLNETEMKIVVNKIESIGYNVVNKWF
jgi:hypothetical protein